MKATLTLRLRLRMPGALAMLLLFAPAAISEDKEQEAVRQTLVAMWDAVENADIDRYASYIHPDFTSFGEYDTYIAKGKDLEVASYADYLKRASDVHTDMHQPEVTVKGDVAWITYYWTDHGMSGGERFTSRGKSTRIFVKEDGKWLCIHGHYTAVP